MEWRMVKPTDDDHADNALAEIRDRLAAARGALNTAGISSTIQKEDVVRIPSRCAICPPAGTGRNRRSLPIRA